MSELDTTAIVAQMRELIARMHDELRFIPDTGPWRAFRADTLQMIADCEITIKACEAVDEQN